MPTSFHMCVGDTIHFSVPEPEQITTDLAILLLL